MELSELDATPREMIVQLIEKQFPIYQYQEQTDPKTGNVIRVRVEDAAGNPEINRENQRRQQELLDKVADLDFPQNPMDALIAHFGVGNVAEISGRTHRFENGKYVRRKLNGVHRRQLNEYETRLVSEGRKRLADHFRGRLDGHQRPCRRDGQEPTAPRVLRLSTLLVGRSADAGLRPRASLEPDFGAGDSAGAAGPGRPEAAGQCGLQAVGGAWAL